MTDLSLDNLPNAQGTCSLGPAPLDYATPSVQRTIPALGTLVAVLLLLLGGWSAVLQWTAYIRLHTRDVDRWLAAELPRRTFERDLRADRWYPGKVRPPLMPIIEAPADWTGKVLGVSSALLALLSFPLARVAQAAARYDERWMIGYLRWRAPLLAVMLLNLLLLACVDRGAMGEMFFPSHGCIGIALFALLTWIIFVEAEKLSSRCANHDTPTQSKQEYGSGSLTSE